MNNNRFIDFFIFGFFLFIGIVFAASITKMPKDFRKGAYVRIERIAADNKTEHYDFEQRLQSIEHQLKCLKVETNVKMSCTKEEITEYKDFLREASEEYEK